jgi:serine/threonine protein kinase
LNDPRSFDEMLATLLIQWEEAWDRGEDLSAEALCVECPELVERVRGRIAALKQMAWMTKTEAEPNSNVIEPDLIVGRTLCGRYQIETLIAEGGFGRVYRAFDPELQRHVAIKISKSRIVSSEQADQLLEEARRAAKLRHPGIVTIYDLGRDEGSVFIVTELIEGQNLAELIECHRPETHQAVGIIADAADALQFAHEQGFIHRDIKPANILIDVHGKPHITDFGIAATVEQITLGEAASSGTLAYMAPEQLGGENHLVGTRTDIHALGVVFYELLTGKNPYDTSNPVLLREQILLRQPKPMIEDHDIPEELRQICSRCLSKHPSDRFNSMAELATSLRNAKSHPQKSSLKLWHLVPLIVVALGMTIWFGSKRISESVDANSVPAEIVLKPEKGTFLFDGKSRIITPLVSFAPCTLEAWIRTTGDKQEQFIIGSDVPNFYGIGIGVNNNLPIVEMIRGGFHIDTPITPGEWTHIAVVYGPDETTLFVNGKKMDARPATELPTHQTHFVIGNVGEDQDRLYFTGHVRSVRISKGERYLGRFEPEISFVADKADDPCQAVLIFDGANIEGDRVVDLSGSGNDGKWLTMKQ